MLRRLSLAAMTLWAASASAAIQNSDFWFHEDGDIVFIDGQRGAPLHIDYIGQALAKPLTVKITPSNSALKVLPSTCTFTKKNHDCRLTLRDAKSGEKIYGVNQFDVTEVGLAQGPVKAQATTDSGSAGFGVGVQQQNMPAPLAATFQTPAGEEFLQTVVKRYFITNSTSQNRTYQGDLVTIDGFDPGGTSAGAGTRTEYKSKPFTIPPKSICYVDYGTWQPDGHKYFWLLISLSKSQYLFIPPITATFKRFFSDITNPLDPIYNGIYSTGENNITTCSAMGLTECSSNKWGSMTVGLANLGSKDMYGGIKAGRIETLRDNSWDSNAGSGNSWIYWEKGWSKEDLALLLIQGSTDGTPFDAQKAAPSILELQSAAPCSYYLKPDQTVTYSVQVQAFGPGTVTMPAGGQCNKYSTPGLDFTYCTGGGYKDSWYEMTAVPDAGKTFKGWTGGNGECDAAGATCRFQLTSDVQFKANFQ